MEFSLNLPINSVSFGQVSLAILRELYRRGLAPYLLPIGNVDVASIEEDPKFFEWINQCCANYKKYHTRDVPVLKLWHFNGSHESVSKKQILITFYELDNPTDLEKNVAKGNVTVLTSKFAQDVFTKLGIETHYIPLGFDSDTFSVVNKKFFDDDRITFNLGGKFERRKNQVRVIKSWLKKFGNNKKYSLQVCCYNGFLKKELNEKIIAEATGGNKYFNLNNLEWIPKNKMYNEYLNSGDIIIGMSSGEGWGIPEFSSLAIGKHGVILNAHSYASWANENNAVLVKPLEQKIDCYDNLFFKKGQEINQGQYFNYNDDEFIAGCEEAIKRVEANRVNEEGLKLQTEFTYKKTVDSLLELLK